MYDDTFKVYVPKEIAFSKDYVNVHEHYICDMSTNYEKKSTMSDTVTRTLNIVDIVNINSSGIEFRFFNREDIPLFYTIVALMIKQMVSNRSRADFDEMVLEAFYEMTDYLYETYEVRLKKHFFNLNNKNVGYSGEITIDQMNFKKIQRQ